MFGLAAGLPGGRSVVRWVPCSSGTADESRSATDVVPTKFLRMDGSDLVVDGWQLLSFITASWEVVITVAMLHLGELLGGGSKG